MSGSTRQIAIKALKKVNRVARDYKPELKFHDITFSGSAANGASGVLSLCDIQTGTTEESERIGNEIKVKRIYGTYLLQVNATADDNLFLTSKPMIVLDKQVDITTTPFLYGEMFDVASVNALQSWDSRKRFKIIQQRWSTVSAGGSNQQRKVGFSHTFKKPLSIHYNGTDGTDLQNNQLCFVHIFDAPNTGTTAGFYGGRLRLEYTDA